MLVDDAVRFDAGDAASGYRIFAAAIGLATETRR